MIEVFTEDCPFIQEDNRRFRPQLRTDAAALNYKHTELLPPHVVRNASVLDLGCCIGATGHWVAQLGGRRYVGVEHQEGYASIARRLLATAPLAEIRQESVEAYLANCNERFEVSCLLGILHGMYDPLALIRQVAERTEKYICCDVTGWNSDRPVIEAVSTYMPIAGQKASSFGFGWFISPLGLRQIMDFLGFAPDSMPEFIENFRWLGRFVRVRQGVRMTASCSNVGTCWDSYQV